MKIIDTLFKSPVAKSNFPIDEKFRLGIVMSNLEGFKNGIRFARFLLSVGVYYYVGIWEAIAVFIGFEIIRIIADWTVLRVKNDLKNDKISTKKAENLLIVQPFGTMIGICTIFLLLTNMGGHSAHDAAYIMLFANLALQIYQNSHSLKLLLVTSILSTILVLYAGYQECESGQDWVGMIAPTLFSIVMFGLALLSFRDRTRALTLRSEMMNKAQKLEQMVFEQEKENQTRQNVERLARVGRFRWLFNGEKAWSPGAFYAFGMDENSPLPNNSEFLNRIVEEDREKYRNVLRESRKNCEGFEFGFRIKSINGEIKQVFCHAAPIFDDENQISGFEGIVVDQSDASIALESMKSAQSLLNVALINGRSVVLERDLENGTMRGYGALDIYDFTEDDDPKYLEDKVMRCLGRRDTHIVFGAMGRAESSGEIQFAEHRIVHSDGEELHVRVALGVEGSLGAGTGRLITITTDITEEVNQRQQLAITLHESQRASRVKSEFLANMSHEIRTPLNGVIAVAGILAKTNLDKNQTEMVKLIENSGEALSHIINDVLDLARVESGRLEVEKIEFNLKEALNSVTALFGVKADEKGLMFDVNIDDTAAKHFIGDPIRIRQIIGNLLSNAIKFTDSGSVSLSATAHKIEGKTNEFQFQFCVKDTGIGMSQEVVERLFERFEQADGSITRKHGGSGLGLSISRALAKLMGGEIAMTSTVGLGSSFIFTLPLTCSSDCKTCEKECDFSRLQTIEATKAEVLNKSDTASDNQLEYANDEVEETGLCILAVDDNATNRRVIDMVLSPMGVDLTLCENGLEAYEAFKIRNFDVILMDLQMPIMDGLSATRKIREYEAQHGGHVPIIAVSANAMSHHVEEAMDAGVDMHIAKPFTPQSLVEGIESALIIAENSPQLDMQEVG